MFTVYGLILLALGIFGSHTVKNKANGINVDLWTGLGMLVFAALMIFWALSRPPCPSRPSRRDPARDRGGSGGRRLT